MSEAGCWALLVLGLLALLARRRGGAVALVSAQSLALAAAAIWLAADGAPDLVPGAAALSVRAVLLGAVLGAVALRTGDARTPEGEWPPLVRVAVAIAAIVALVALVPRVGLETVAAERTAIAIAAVGLTALVARRDTLLQALGLLVAENGVALAAISVEGGPPVVIELGVVVDVILVLTAAAVFHRRIVGTLGTSDVARLGRLRD